MIVHGYREIVVSVAASSAAAVCDGRVHRPILEVWVEEDGEGGAGKVPEVGDQPKEGLDDLKCKESKGLRVAL